MADAGVHFQKSCSTVGVNTYLIPYFHRPQDNENQEILDQGEGPNQKRASSNGLSTLTVGNPIDLMTNPPEILTEDARDNLIGDSTKTQNILREVDTTTLKTKTTSTITYCKTVR